MYSQPNLEADDIVGDFDELMRQLSRPNDEVSVNGAYTTLMTRIAAPDFRKQYEKRN